MKQFFISATCLLSGPPARRDFTALILGFLICEMSVMFEGVSSSGGGLKKITHVGLVHGGARLSQGGPGVCLVPHHIPSA